MCDYCEPSHGRKMGQLRNRKIWNDRLNRNYRIRIGKSWKGNKFKNHKLMLFSHQLFVASLSIDYCPFCGRRLQGYVESLVDKDFDMVAEKTDSHTNEIGYELVQLSKDIYAKRDVEQFCKRHDELLEQLNALKSYVLSNRKIIEDWGEKQDERLQENS